jgi:hypothetical protein
MKKELCIGIAKDYGKVVIEIEIREINRQVLDWDRVNPVEHPRELTISGHYRGSWGQIYDELLDMDWKENFIGNRNLVRLVLYWKQYHLNGMKPGTKRQMEFLEFAKSCPHIKWNRLDHYETSIHLLKQHSLLVDYDTYYTPYEYGSNWLFAELPPEVIHFFEFELTASPPSKNRPELLDWMIENHVKFEISPTDANPDMLDSKNPMDHWRCSFWYENNPTKKFICNFSRGYGHRIGGDHLTNQQITRKLNNWRRELYAQFEVPFPTFTTGNSQTKKVSLSDLGFNCSVPTVVFSHMDSLSFAIPPMPNEVLSCVAREIQDAHNYSDWTDWAEDLGFSLEGKSERRRLRKAFIIIEDQADRFNAVFHDFPFELCD